MRFVPDWLIYSLVLAAVLIGIFRTTPSDNAPPPPPEAMEQEGALLGPASELDERVLVEVGEPQTGIGTAFAINTSGQWLTARHVVDGCDALSLLVAPDRYLPIDAVRISNDSDLALLETPSRSLPVPLNTVEDLRVGTRGYHVGYPQGRPGEAAARLVSRSNLVSDGRRKGTESVLAWAEIGRTRGLTGSLGGLSGGPVFDADGRVRGVVIAESPRRGRIYTASPETVAGFLTALGVTPVSEQPRPIEPDSYGREADRARRELQVVKVACLVGAS